MPYLLNVAYLGLLPVVSPWLIYSAIRHGKYRQGWGQKLFGRTPSLKRVNKRLWFHAVSVGEVNLIAGVIEELSVNSASHPDASSSIDVVISTTTKTGYELAKKKYDKHTVFYCPLDFTWSVRSAFDRIKPTHFVLAELELWPNLLLEAAKRDVPVAIINGRLSDRSTTGYLRLKKLLGSWMNECLRSIHLVTAQSESCAQRFVQIGIEPSRVSYVGSLKFDGAKTDRNNELTQTLATQSGIAPDDFVFLAGSTQAPEEHLAIRVFSDLAQEHANLRLIIVPRHPERFEEVAQLLLSEGVEFSRHSQHKDGDTAKRVLLVDTVGELGGWWGCASVGFVGGSLGSRGGQNMIEPAAYGVATCFGPNTKNFRAIVEQLLNRDAAYVVANGDELRDFVQRCLTEPEFRNATGSRAQDIVLSQRGSLAKTVDLLHQLIDSKPTSTRYRRSA